MSLTKVGHPAYAGNLLKSEEKVSNFLNLKRRIVNTKIMQMASLSQQIKIIEETIVPLVILVWNCA